MVKKGTKGRQTTLFVEPQARDTKGRFCTRDRSLYERTLAENARLRFEKEKYFRAYLAVARDNERLQRELLALKEGVAYQA